MATGTFVSRTPGCRSRCASSCRIVDARYLAPDIPADAAAVARRVRPRCAQRRTASTTSCTLAAARAPVRRGGLGKTATGAIVAAGRRGVRSGLLLCWVRPREAVDAEPGAAIQPSPRRSTCAMVATMTLAAPAPSLDARCSSELRGGDHVAGRSSPDAHDGQALHPGSVGLELLQLGLSTWCAWATRSLAWPPRPAVPAAPALPSCLAPGRGGRELCQARLASRARRSCPIWRAVSMHPPAGPRRLPVLRRRPGRGSNKPHALSSRVGATRRRPYPG